MRSARLQANCLVRLCRAGFLSIGLSSLAFVACSAAADPIHVVDAWSRTAALKGNGVGYLTITNPGPRADRLVGADTAVAEKVSIHTTRMVGAMMAMRALDGVDIPVGSTVSFAPGGSHLMFETLKRPLEYGQRIKITLIFARAGRVAASFTVRYDAPSRRAIERGAPKT